MSEEGELKTPSWVERIPRVSVWELFEKYRRRIVHRDTGLPFEPRKLAEAPVSIENLAFQTGAGFRLVLSLFMPVCAVLFLFSFLWDVQGVIRSCSVAGMIGFGTNWVAIKMLFWPRESRPVFGHGLIPSQRDQLIDKVAQEVLEKLINEDLIFAKIEESRVVTRFSEAWIEKLREVLKDPEFQRDLRSMLLTYAGALASDASFRDGVADKAQRRLEEFAGSAFKGWVVKKLHGLWRPPLIEALNQELEGLEETVDGGLGQMEAALERLPRALEHRREQIDRVLTTMLMGLVREVDVRSIVFEQLAEVTSEQLEQGFREFSDDKLSFITLVGGCLGFVGGLVIVWPLRSIGVLVVLALVLTLLDVVLARSLAATRAPKTEDPQRADGGV